MMYFSVYTLKYFITINLLQELMIFNFRLLKTVYIEQYPYNKKINQLLHYQHLTLI